MASAILIQAIPTRLLSQIATDGTVTQMRQQLRFTCGISQESALNGILGTPQESNEPPRSLVTRISNAISTALPEADDNTKKRLLVSRYIASMPLRIRELLTVFDDQTIDKLVELTEKLQSSVFATNSSSINNINQQPPPKSSPQVDATQQLQEQLNQLTITVNKLVNHHRGRSTSPNHSQFKRRERSSSQRFQMNNEDPRCYYHQRWGNKARKCTCKIPPN